MLRVGGGEEDDGDFDGGLEEEEGAELDRRNGGRSGSGEGREGFDPFSLGRRSSAMLSVQLEAEREERTPEGRRAAGRGRG